jgi:hypothetical protein
MPSQLPTGWVAPKPARSVPKLVVGIILTVLGAFGTLGLLSALASGGLAIPDTGSSAFATGYVIGELLWVVALIVGIALIVTSKRK